MERISILMSTCAYKSDSTLEPQSQNHIQKLRKDPILAMLLYAEIGVTFVRIIFLWH